MAIKTHTIKAYLSGISFFSKVNNRQFKYGPQPSPDNFTS